VGSDTGWVAWLRKRHDWPSLNAVVIVESLRETSDKQECAMRCYITSLLLVAIILAPILRGHWAIEYSLHRVLDMAFRDDESRLQTNHAPANFCSFKHMARNRLRQAPYARNGWPPDGTMTSSPHHRVGSFTRLPWKVQPFALTSGSRHTIR